MVLDATSSEGAGAKPAGLIGLACAKGIALRAIAAPKERPITRRMDLLEILHESMLN